MCRSSQSQNEEMKNEPIKSRRKNQAIGAEHGKTHVSQVTIGCNIKFVPTTCSTYAKPALFTVLFVVVLIVMERTQVSTFVYILAQENKNSRTALDLS